MIKTAVILAAGLGSRLKDKTKEIPKGFLEIGGCSLIQRSVEALLEAGIERIVIGTGYLNEVYESFAEHYPQIVCIKSDKYAVTSSMYTLWNMKSVLTDDFLLLESDLLYEKLALRCLLEDECRDVILSSGTTWSNDEVYIQASTNDMLESMSKQKDSLESIHSELVGISKVSADRYLMMCEAFEALGDERIDYEYIMVQTTKQKEFFVKKVDDLIWCEIDDEGHFERAKKYILPNITLKDTKRNILLNPGPATTTQSVKMAQVVPDICPREKEFGDLMESVSADLTEIVANCNDYTTILFGGSGTAAVEAVLSSVVPHEKKILIVNNGAYGERICQIAAAYEMPFIEFKSSALEPIDLVALEHCLQQSTNISHLAVIHNETTTGLLNDLTELGVLADRYGIELIVDAMSSYAAVPIDMERQHITYLVASSNKNVQGMAGIGFVIANKACLEKTQQIQPRNFYLNLYAQYDNFRNSHQMRFTPPVQTLYALKQAILETKEEGVSNRYARYSQSWHILTKALKKLGLPYLVDDAYHSKIITSINMPDGVDFNDLHDAMQQAGFTIYPGKVAEFNTFRVANIGDIDHKDIQRFVEVLNEYLRTVD